jgi:hypothetical protein
MNHLTQLSRRQAKTVLTSATYLPMSVGQVAMAASDYPATGLDPSLQDLSEVIFCKNTSGGTLPVGSLLVRDSAEEPLGYGVKLAPTSQHPLTVVGVVPEGLVDGDGTAVTAVADGSYFFAIRKGNVKVITNTDNVTIDLGIIVSAAAAGAGKNAAATTGAACGFWLANGTAPALTLARIAAQG